MAVRLTFNKGRCASSDIAPLQSGTGQSIYNWADKSGEFKRGQSQFRDHVSKQPGAEFPAEKGRYHLYVSYACPWG